MESLLKVNFKKLRYLVFLLIAFIAAPSFQWKTSKEKISSSDIPDIIGIKQANADIVGGDGGDDDGGGC